MTYKGYIGVAKVDEEAGVIRGKVVNTRDTITFQGETVAAAITAFHESVDDYLEFCKELDEEPDKPFSGRILLRLPPDMHRKLSLVAQIKGLSVNRLVNREIKRVVRGYGIALPAPSVAPAVPSPPRRSRTRRIDVE